MSVGIGSVAIVQRDVVVDIDPASLAEAVDPGSYERGVQYVRQHAVVRALWKLSAGALAGTVRGQYGNVYTTTARFSSADGLVHRFEQGECSCPVGFNCKHVVALVLTATGALRPDGKGRPDEAGRPQEDGGAAGRGDRRRGPRDVGTVAGLAADVREGWLAGYAGPAGHGGR